MFIMKYLTDEFHTYLYFGKSQNSLKHCSCMLFTYLFSICSAFYLIEEMSFVFFFLMGILYLTVIYDLKCFCLFCLGGPAHQAGLQQLDTVLQLNGQPVEHWKCVDLAHAIRCDVFGDHFVATCFTTISLLILNANHLMR